jgi:hypothetical protein
MKQSSRSKQDRKTSRPPQRFKADKGLLKRL